MLMEIDSRVYLTPGNIVRVKHNIENRPKMIVTEKANKSIKNKDGEYESLFVGIKCIWFDKNQDLQTAIFNTKDLELIEE